MRKFLVLVGLLSFLLSNSFAAESNLIANSGFEITGVPSERLAKSLKIPSGKAVPMRWEYRKTGKCDFSVVSDAHSGKQALKIVTGKHSRLDMWLNVIEVIPGAPYKIAGWFKGVGNASISVYGRYFEGLREIKTFKVVSGKEWTKFSEDFKAPRSVRKISLKLSVDPKSDLTVDDLFFSTETEKAFFADDILSKKPVKDENTLLFVDFDENKEFTKDGKGTKLVENGRFGKGLRVGRNPIGNAVIPIGFKMPAKGTLEFWMAPDDAPKHIYRFAELFTGRQDQIYLTCATDNQISCVWRPNGKRYPKNKGRVSARNIISKDWLKAGQWHHVAIQWDGEAVRYYLNGVLVDFSTKLPQPFFQNPSGLRIGCMHSGYSWPGLVDEIRISDVQRYGPIVPTGHEWKPLVAKKIAVVAPETKEADVTPRAKPDLDKEREKLIGKLPADPKDSIVIGADKSKALIHGDPMFKILDNNPFPGMKIASFARKKFLGDPDSYGAYWKLYSLPKGKYWVGVWYESGPGSRGPGKIFLYLNGRVVQLSTTSDSIQVAKGRYFAEAQSDQMLELKTGDELAVTSKRGSRLSVLKLVLQKREPKRGMGRLYHLFGENFFIRDTSLKLSVKTGFEPVKGKKVTYPQRFTNQEVELPAPSAIKTNANGQGLAFCEIENPLPVELKIKLTADIKSYFRKQVGKLEEILTIPAHGKITKTVPFEIVPGSKRYSFSAIAKAIDPPDLNWPLDTISFFPGVRQNLEFPDPFYGKDEMTLIFSKMLEGPRKEFSLNGTWNSAFTTSLEPPVPAPANLKWRNWRIPFKRYMCDLTKITPRPHGMYLKRNFTIPETGDLESYQLTITKVTDEATVYVNGKKLGNVRGANTPLICDITSGLKPGKNEIIIVLRDLLAIMNPAYVNPKDPIPASDYLDAPGLFGKRNLGMGSVMVKTSPAVYAHNPLAIPSVRKKELDGFYYVTNNLKKDIKINLDAEVLDVDKPVLNLDKRDVSLKPGETKKIVFNKAWADPELWGPGNPKLYTLAVKVNDTKTGKKLDLLRERFGFRESWIDGDKIYFNGKPVRLKGSSVHGGQGMGLDDVQLSRGAKAPYFLDEFGYLASHPLAQISNSSSRHNVERDQFWKSATDNVLIGAATLGNHPCIIAWDLSNEWLCFLDYGGGDPMAGARRFKTLSNTLQKFDPSRWTFFNGDEDLHGLHDTFSTHYMLEATNPHPIDGFGFNGHSNYFPDGAFFRPLDKDLKKGDKLCINTHRKIMYEYGSKVLMNTENMWKQGRYMPPGPAKFADEEDVVSAAIDSGRGPVAWMWKQNNDGHRDLGVSAIYNYTCVVGVSRRGHMIQCFIMPDHTHHYFSGSTLKRSYSLHNDELEAAEFKFTWELVDPNATTGFFSWFSSPVIESGDDVREMTSGGLERGEFSFTVPEVDSRKKYVLRLKLHVDGSFIYGEERDIEVWPNEPTPLAPLARELRVFDPKGETLKIFKKAGIAFTKTDLSGEWPNPANTAIIIGYDAMSAVKLPADKIEKYVRAGGRVLVLSQKKTIPGLPVKTNLEKREWVSMPFVRTPQHPIFSGDFNTQYPISNHQSSNKNSKSQISSWDLSFWNPGHVSAKGAYSKPFEGSFVTLLDSGNKNGLEWTEMMETYLGKGLFLLNQMCVIEKYDSEPMARELLARMLDYIGNNKSFKKPTKKLLTLSPLTKGVLNKLKSLEVPCESLSEKSKLKPNSVLLIDAQALKPDFKIPVEWKKALKDGADIVVHNVGPENGAFLSNLAGKPVEINAHPYPNWEGRGFRKGFTDLTAGLSHIDLYWKDYETNEAAGGQADKRANKIDDLNLWSVKADGAVEHVFPGALLEIPVGEGRLIIDQMCWDSNEKKLNSLTSRCLSVLLTSLNVEIPPFTPPKKLPKNVKYKPLDLTKFANRGFIDKVGDDGEGGWSDQGPKIDLREFPTGRKNFGRVPYLIGKEPKCCIVIKSNKRPFPDKLPASVTVPVGYPVEGFFFLHSVTYLGGGNAGEYEIEYEDGSKIKIPLVADLNIRDWVAAPAAFTREKQTSSRVAWTGSTKVFDTVCVFEMLWVNPKPNIPIKAVKFDNPGRNGCPILIALTAAVKDLRSKEEIKKALAQADKFLETGLAAFKKNDNKVALASLKKAVKLNPQLELAYQTMGEIYLKAKDDNALMKCYQAWIANGASTPLPYNRVAEVLEAKKDYKGALEMIEKSLDVEWNQPPTIVAKSRLMKLIKEKKK